MGWTNLDPFPLARIRLHLPLLWIPGWCSASCTVAWVANFGIERVSLFRWHPVWSCLPSSGEIFHMARNQSFYRKGKALFWWQLQKTINLRMKMNMDEHRRKTGFTKAQKWRRWHKVTAHQGHHLWTSGRWYKDLPGDMGMGPWVETEHPNCCAFLDLIFKQKMYVIWSIDPRPCEVTWGNTYCIWIFGPKIIAN